MEENKVNLSLQLDASQFENLSLKLVKCHFYAAWCLEVLGAQD